MGSGSWVAILAHEVYRPGIRPRLAAQHGFGRVERRTRKTFFVPDRGKMTGSWLITLPKPKDMEAAIPGQHGRA